MTDRAHIPCITVLAGTNGAGKSSVGGEMFFEVNSEFLDPDEAALKYPARNPEFTLEEANVAAWHEGKRLLERAISERLDYSFETTLGGHTIARLLHQALTPKIEVRIWYVGLATPELHIARVRSRVAAGGHDIPEGKIRQRFKNSLLNLVDLMSKLTELRVYDNSEEADPRKGLAPQPKLLLHMDHGKIVDSCDLTTTPEWAKPILVTAMKLTRKD